MAYSDRQAVFLSQLASVVYELDVPKVLQYKAETLVSFDPFALWYDNEGRPDCAEWFGAHGWVARTVDSRD